jgi:nucleoside-diphosphate-sugar epimerase
MRVFVAGGTGVIGKYLVPSLIAAGHEVTGTTRSPAKASDVQAAGATPVIVDGLGRQAVLDGVKAAQPEIIVHQMTAPASMMTQARGSSNEKAKRDLSWAPRYASWRDGFPEWVQA